MEAVTQILDAIKSGDPQAAERLLPVVYDELRNLAAAQLAWEKAGHSLNATALVHEAYLRLVGDQKYNDRVHFFRVAAEAIRRVLVDHARKKNRVKYGGGLRRVSLSDLDAPYESPPEEFLALNSALEKLAVVAPEKAELVKLRFFAGMSEEEAASALGISRATATRQWTFARAWLIASLEKTQDAAEFKFS